MKTAPGAALLSGVEILRMQLLMWHQGRPYSALGCPHESWLHVLGVPKGQNGWGVWHPLQPAWTSMLGTVLRRGKELLQNYLCHQDLCAGAVLGAAKLP